MLTTVVADALPQLARRLCHTLAQPLDDPMVSEWIAVPSAGMRQWLALELAKVLGAASADAHDGISANIDFVGPAALERAIVGADDLRRGVSAANGSAAGSVVSPWRTEPLLWTVLGIAATDPALATRAGTTAAPLDPAWARRVARRFDRYHVRRPEMVRQWALGHDVGAQGAPLGPDHQWQAELWRAARAEIGEPSPPERLITLLDEVRDGRLVLQLPHRLSLFGFTSLPGGEYFLRVLDAVAIQHDVELLLLDPSPATSLDAANSAASARTRAEARSAQGNNHAVHPLVGSWARVSVEAVHLVANELPNASVEILPSATVTQPKSLLEALQFDVHAGTPPHKSYVPDDSDRSVQLHVCQGPVRQVEVLRDALLHLLADDAARSDETPKLTENDVVVVCPDLDRFAPIIRAVFGDVSGQTQPDADELRAPALRFVMTDRRAASSNPVLDVLVKLLDLVTGPVGADAVLELCASPPVQATFGFDADSLDTIHSWVDELHVSWGLDADHRVPFGAPAYLTSNTWQAAIDALLLGTAMSGDDAIAAGNVLAYPTSSGAPDIVGRLADLIARVRRMASECTISRPMHEWLDLVRGWIDELVTPDDDTTRGLESVRRMLADIDTQVATAAEPAAAVQLTALAARQVLVEQLGRASSRDTFFLGGITVTSLESLRWVPRKVVAVLGLDHAALGSPKIDGDDLSALEPLIGDVDRRAETRQAVLEAVLAAQDHLLVLRDGTDLTKGADVPESVMVTELREALLATVAPAERDATAARIETIHPRHSSDVRCFEPDKLGRASPWGFDPIALTGAQARAHPVEDKARWHMVPRDPAQSVDLDELRQFLANPTATYVRTALAVHLPKVSEDAARHLPVEITSVEAWALKQRLLDAGSADTSGQPDQAAIELARGALPVAGLGRAALADAQAKVDPIAAELERRFPDGTATEPVVIDLVFDDGTRLGGVINVVPGSTPGTVSASPSKVKVTDHLTGWLHLMALTATDPSQPWRTTAIRATSKPKQSDTEVLVLQVVETDDAETTALDALQVAVSLWRRSLQEPIPLFPATSAGLASDDGPNKNDWHGYPYPTGDADKDAVKFIYGDLTLRELRMIKALPTDPGEGEFRAKRYADVLWKAIGASCDKAPDEEEMS